MTVRILLVRHGESEGNQNPALYIEKGDSRVGLTETGWRQVAGTGQFLATYCHEVGLTKWPLFYLSPLTRTKESCSGILHGMGSVFPGNPKIHLQSFLVEKFFGAASALAFPDGKVAPEIVAAISHLSKRVYQGDPFTAKHLFGESTKDTMLAAKVLIDGTLRRDIEEGTTDFVIVCHGAVIQAIIMAWAHIDPKDKNKIGNPGNGDVIEIAGEPKNWAIRKVYNGEQGIRVDIDMLRTVHRFTLTDLPPVPDFLKAKP